MMDRMDDDEQLRAYGAALSEAVEASLPGWVERGVLRIASAWQGAPDPAVLAEAKVAGERAGREVGAEIRTLLARDIDEQATTPLSLLRGAVRYPTAVLERAGVPPVERDEFAERAFPEDIYGLSPASFGDIDPALHEPGLVWGAAKAHVHLSRRRAEGRR
jgi:hypothetical protein